MYSIQEYKLHGRYDKTISMIWSLKLSLNSNDRNMVSDFADALPNLYNFNVLGGITAQLIRGNIIEQTQFYFICSAWGVLMNEAPKNPK